MPFPVASVRRHLRGVECATACGLAVGCPAPRGRGQCADVNQMLQFLKLMMCGLFKGSSASFLTQSQVTSHLFPHELISGDRSHPWPTYGPSGDMRRSRGASVANDVLHGSTRYLGNPMEPDAYL